MKLNIIKHRCSQSNACPSVDRCPIKALTQQDFNAPKVDNNKCIKCGYCINFCPNKVLILE